MLLWLHILAAAGCASLLSIQFIRSGWIGRASWWISFSLMLVMSTGLALMLRAGGLAYALFFGHLMHWLGWLAVLAWLHALARARSSLASPRTAVSLALVLAASVAGLLALIQPTI